MTEEEERQRVVYEARKWLGTPYVSNGDVLGAGVDCGMLLVRAFVDSGRVAPFDPRPYPTQWALHQSAEVMLGIVQSYAKEVEGREPLPADVVLFKFGKCWAHASIVSEWPWIIHANPPGDCREDNVRMNLRLANTPKRIFSPW